MKKKLLAILLCLFLLPKTHSQNLDCLSEFSYQMVKFDEGILRTKHGQFTVCLWEDNFSFMFPDGSTTSFQADRIDKDVNKDGITEVSFINKETESIAFGTYLVTIRYGKIKEIEIQNTLAGVLFKVKSKHFIGQPDAYGITKIKKETHSVKEIPKDTPTPKPPTVSLLGQIDSINQVLNPHLFVRNIAPTISIQDYLQKNTKWIRNRYEKNAKFSVTFVYLLEPDYSIKEIKVSGFPYDMQKMNSVISNEISNANIKYVDNRDKKEPVYIRETIMLSE